MSKVCRVCEVELALEVFPKAGRVCKPCRNAERREKRQNDPVFKERANALAKARRQNPDVKEREKIGRDAYRARPEIREQRKRAAEAYRNTPERKQAMQNYHMDYYAENKAQILEKNRRNEMRRLETDPNFKARKCLRSELRDTLRTGGNRRRILRYTGCDVDYLRTWFAYQFDENMNWENQGAYWSVDHIDPCSNYDLTDEDQRRICFDWKNLRPVESIANMRKNAKNDPALRARVDELVRLFIEEHGEPDPVEFDDDDDEIEEPDEDPDEIEFDDLADDDEADGAPGAQAIEINT